MLLFREYVVLAHVFHKGLAYQLFHHLAADGRETHRSVVTGAVTAALLVDGGDPRPFPCLRNLADV